MSETKKKSFMEKFEEVCEKTLLPVGTKIASQRHLASIRDGMAILIPVTITGGLAILLAQPPIPSTVTEPSNILYAFLLAWKSFADAYSGILFIPYYLSIGIISLYVVVGISYRLSEKYGLDKLTSVIGSLFVFLSVSDAMDISTGSINTGMLGAGYMFGAIIIAILTVEITNFFVKRNITIKLPDSVPPNVGNSFISLIPTMFNIVLFTLLNILCTKVTGAGITSLIFTIFQPIMSATGSLPSLLLLSTIQTLFWFFGIHGDNMVSPVVTPITTAGLAANMEAYAAGVAPNALPYIFAGSMMVIFSGWINAHARMICMNFFCKSEQLRAIPKVAIIPSLFNINEPSVFGVPTVLNVYLLLPDMLCNVVGISLYYFLAKAGIVGRFFVSVPWTTPVYLQAFLGTMDWKNLVLSFALLAIFTCIQLPFVKIYDKTLCEQEAANKAE